MWEQLTFWSEEPPAKTSASQAKGRVLKEPVPASHLTLCDWLMKRAVNTSSGKTFPAYSVPTGEEISLPFYPCSADTPSTFRKTDGSQAESSRTADLTAMASRGECWTRNLPEFPAFRSPYPNADGVCSLSDVLETGNVPPQYYLSPTACRGILHRASKRGKSLPEILEKALLRQSECEQDARGGGKGALVGDNLSHTLQTGNDQTVVEFAQDCANTVEASFYKGPCGTWNERTIVSQFWNGSDVAESVTTTSNNQRMPDKCRMQMVIANVFTLDADSSNSMKSANPNSGIHEADVAKTLDTTVPTPQKAQGGQMIMCFHGSQDPISNEANANAIGRNGGLENCICLQQNQLGEVRTGNVAGTIGTDSNASGRNTPLCFQQNTRDEVRKMNGDGEIAGALAAQPGMKQQNYLCYDNQTYARNPQDTGNICGTLEAHMGTRGNTVPLIQNAVAIAENVIGRKVENGGNGIGAQDELAYTQNATGVMGVMSLNCQGGSGIDVQEEVTDTVTAASNSSGNNKFGVCNAKTVRRLTPVEAERLMGHPDNHTRISWQDKPEEECPDAPRYKAEGNSMCVNCMEWIGRRIEEFDE